MAILIGWSPSGLPGEVIVGDGSPASLSLRLGMDETAATIRVCRDCKDEWFRLSSTVTGARYQLTTGGGSHPLWTPDGRSLFFDRDDQMFRLRDLLTRAQLTPLPITGFAQAEYRRQFDLMPDGRHFLMLFPIAAAR